jgi:hypothetical protein
MRAKAAARNLGATVHATCYGEGAPREEATAEGTLNAVN